MDTIHKIYAELTKERVKDKPDYNKLELLAQALTAQYKAKSLLESNDLDSAYVFVELSAYYVRKANKSKQQ